MRFLHLADLHLGWRPNFLPPGQAAALQQARDQVFDQAVEQAIVRQVDAVIIAGDLFESHRPAVALAEGVRRGLGRLLAAGISVVTVPGNHDEITYHDSVYRAAWPGVLVSNPQPARVARLVLGGGPVHLYSVAYTGGVTGPITRLPRAKGEGLHLAVFHGSLDWQAGERSLPIASEALVDAGYDYVALGHIHRPQVKGRAVYPGAPAGKGFHDPGCGYLTEVELQPGGRFRLLEIPVALPRFETLELDGGAFASLAELKAFIERRAAADLLLRIELTGALDFALDGHWPCERFFHLEVIDRTVGLAPELLAAWAQEATLRGEYVRRLQGALAAAEDEAERRRLQTALRLGLAALLGGEA